MKKIVFLIIALFIIPFKVFPSYIDDNNNDGSIDEVQIIKSPVDINGDGKLDSVIYFSLKTFIEHSHQRNISPINFTSFWTSPSGAFTNCWDGAIGYFDNDTLLDIAGYTFSPSKFYVYEQVASKPDSFALVYENIKTEGGGFGPMTFGDTDGDGKIEIILADFATFTRIYIFENDGNNTYVSQNTQTVLTHTNDGETARSLYISDMNKNGKKEIVCSRGSTDGGMVRIWEHNGVVGSNTYNNIYTYTTVTYIFGAGGLGDSDNDSYPELFLTFGGLPTFNTYIRRIEFDSVSASFVHLQFQATSIGFPASYKVTDVNNDGTKELVMTGNSNNKASVYIFKNNGANSFEKLDSIFEYADNNNMLTQDINILQGATYPSILCGSFNGKIYIYQFDGSAFTKQFEKLDYAGPAIRRVYWTKLASIDGYFNTWSSSSNDGTYYIFKKDNPTGITKNDKVPDSYELYQNYPNPFNPKSNIKYQISKTQIKNQKVKLIVYNSIGQELAILVNQIREPGTYEVTFDGTNYPSGVYFYVLKAGEFTDTKKLILMK